MAPSLRRITKGALVSVKPLSTPGRRASEGKIGVVEKRKRKKTDDDGQEVLLTQETTATGQSGETVFDVRYTLDKRYSPAVKKDRVQIAALNTTARRSSLSSDDLRPSLLSPQHRPSVANAAVSFESNLQSRNEFVRYSHAWLIANTTKRERNGQRTLIAVLQRKKKDRHNKGWLRQLESRVDPPEKQQKQLTEKEKRKTMDLLLACGGHDSTVPLVAFAWGVDPSTIRYTFNKMK